MTGNRGLGSCRHRGRVSLLAWQQCGLADELTAPAEYAPQTAKTEAPLCLLFPPRAALPNSAMSSADRARPHALSFAKGIPGIPHVLDLHRRPGTRNHDCTTRRELQNTASVRRNHFADVQLSCFRRSSSPRTPRLLIQLDPRVLSCTYHRHPLHPSAMAAYTGGSPQADHLCVLVHGASPPSPAAGRSPLAGIR